MALTLEANYSKKIGLPGYSSHQYSLMANRLNAGLGVFQGQLGVIAAMAHP